MKFNLLITAFGLLAAGNTAYALNIYRTGFENPPFTTGNLSGQDGWSGVPGLSLSAAQISKAKPRQGKQSVLVRGADLQSDQVIPVNLITAGYYNAIGNYRKTVDFDSLGSKSVRISAHVRLIGSKTANMNNFFSASIGARGADVISSVPSGTTGIGELAISSDGHVYGYSGNEDVPGCFNIPCNPPASFLTGRLVLLNEWHELSVVINFKKRTYSFSVDDTCLGAFPFIKGFTGNYMRRGFLNVYAAPDTSALKKADYAAMFDQLKISQIDDDEDCIH